MSLGGLFVNLLFTVSLVNIGFIIVSDKYFTDDYVLTITKSIEKPTQGSVGF